MRPSTLSGASVLLVESSAIIGLDLADGLEGLGYGVVGPFACADALQWLETATPDLALLDVDLRSGPCVTLAHRLRARQVPILVFSSHDRRSSLAEFHDLPWLSMPASLDCLDAALRALATGQGSASLDVQSPRRSVTGPRMSWSRRRDRPMALPEGPARALCSELDSGTWTLCLGLNPSDPKPV